MATGRRAQAAGGGGGLPGRRRWRHSARNEHPEPMALSRLIAAGACSLRLPRQEHRARKLRGEPDGLLESPTANRGRVGLGFVRRETATEFSRSGELSQSCRVSSLLLREIAPSSSSSSGQSGLGVQQGRLQQPVLKPAPGIAYSRRWL